LRNPDNKQTNKLTYADENKTSLAEVINFNNIIYDIGLPSITKKNKNKKKKSRFTHQCEFTENFASTDVLSIELCTGQYLKLSSR